MEPAWLVAPLALGGALLPLLDRGGPRARNVLPGAALLLLAPCLLPAEPRWLRFAVTVATLTCAAKLLDALLDGRPWPPLRSWLGWLAMPFGMVRARIGDEPLLAPRAALARVGLGLGQAALGAGLSLLAWRAPPLPFLAEHALRVLSFYVLLEGTAIALVAAARGLGLHAREVLDRPWLACTPADFWRRYNRVVGQLLRSCWRAWGGRRAPLRATLLVFLFSGLFHEYLFWVVLGRAQGVQTAFFLLQGLSVALTAHRDPRGAARGLGIALTLTWNLASGVLFFASMEQTFPGIWSSWPLPFARV